MGWVGLLRCDQNMKKHRTRNEFLLCSVIPHEILPEGVDMVRIAGKRHLTANEYTLTSHSQGAVLMG